MRELGENEALLVKEVDSGIKCSWAWLTLDATIEVKGTPHTFPLSYFCWHIEEKMSTGRKCTA
jgi:hypothetical protein